VSARSGDGPYVAKLRAVDRVVVAVLARALPRHFRARQRAEWTGDLLVLAQDGRYTQWRYLLGAARTLPALRAAARRTAADGVTSEVAGPSPSLVLISRVLVITLVWTVVSWLVMLPGRYLYYGPDRYLDSIWPSGVEHPALLPLVVLLSWGAAGAAIDVPLVPTAALLAVIFVALERRSSGPDRWRTAILRTAVIAAAAVSLTAIDLFIALMTSAGGPMLPLLGLAAAMAGMVGPNLSKRYRIPLIVVGLAATAIALINNTVGLPMVVWFRD
jgi:hypothetical protein